MFLDLLHQRYANPYPFIDGMLQTCRFNEFVDSFLETVGKEREEKHEWEYFLHKVWEGSFQEFKEEIRINKQNQSMDNRTMETTINESLSILQNFTPC